MSAGARGRRCGSRGLFASTLTLLVASPLFAKNPGLERCRALESEFDYRAMITECGVAAADPTNTREERLELYRLLGIAHAALGDEVNAQVWFLRLLYVDPQHQLPPEVSPKFRQTFEKAVARFEAEGKVTVRHTPPKPPERIAPSSPGLPIRFEIVDKLGRVASARVDVKAMVAGQPGPLASAELSREATETEGVFRLTGELPDPARAPDGSAPAEYSLEYTLTLRTALGDPVEPDPPFPPQTLSLRGAESDDGTVLTLVAVGAGALGLAVLGTAVGVGAYCYVVGCPPTPPVVRISPAGVGGTP